MARRFRGPLVTVGQQTGDGRIITDNAISVAPLPLPFAWIKDGDQHMDSLGSAPQVGIIDSVVREGNDWIGEGLIDDDQPDGAELARRMDAGLASHGHRQFVSIDPDDWAVDIMMIDGETDEEVLVASSTGSGPLPATSLVAASGDPEPEGGTLLMTDASDAILQRYTRMRIRGATACAVSAFDTAWVELVADEAEAEVVEDEPAGDIEAITADGSPVTFYATGNGYRRTFTIGDDQITTDLTPSGCFALPEPEPGMTDDGSLYGMPVQELLVEQPDGGLGVPFTIVERGGWYWCFGHAARWGQCHVGYPDQCVTAPESVTGYAEFHTGTVLTDHGLIPTGPLTVGTDHAAAHLLAPDARDHYANTGLAFADVRASNGDLGVWVTGRLRRNISPDIVDVIRASALSGDWRNIGLPTLEFIGALAVNTPGFGVTRHEPVASMVLDEYPTASLVASSHYVDGVQQSLTAAGVVVRCSECAKRAAMTAALNDGMVSAEEFREALGLLRSIDARTRHLIPVEAERTLRSIRR